MATDKIYAEYRLELDSLKKDLAKVNKEFEKSNKDIKKGQSEIEKGFNNIGSSIVAAFSVAALVQFGKEVINVTAEFQKMEAVLTNTLGSSSKAKKAMADIVKFASETPFQVNELTGAFVKLANMGFVPTQKEMRKLGDLASSTGKEFDQLAEAIIDAQTGEFERLKEFGIRASKEGENVKFTFKGIETQTKFTSEAIKDYILSLGDVEGVSGSMAAVSKTLGGQISNLSDNFDQLLLVIGNQSEGVISKFIGLTAEMLIAIKTMIEMGDLIGFNGVFAGFFADADAVGEAFDKLTAREKQNNYKEWIRLIGEAKQIGVAWKDLTDLADFEKQNAALDARIEAQKKLNAENEKALEIAKEEAKLRNEWNAQRGTEIDEQIKTGSQLRIENARNEADSIVEINKEMSEQLLTLNEAVKEDNIRIAQEQALAKVEAEQFAQQQLLALLNVLAQDSKALAVFQVLISQGVSIANAIQGASAASAAGGPAAPFLLAGYIASMVGAVVTGFKQVHSLTSADAPQFYEGTEDVTSAIAMHNLKTAKDPYVVRVHPHERIVSAMDNKRLGSISNKELANAVEFYQQYKNFTIGSSSESFDYKTFDKINRKGALTVASKIDELIGLEREKYLHSKRSWL